MKTNNEWKIKYKYVLLPITGLEIFTVIFLLLVNDSLLKFDLEYHLLYLMLVFLPFGYIQYCFYRILDYNEYGQLKSYTALIGLKSLMPTLHLVSVVYHKFHKQEVTDLNEKAVILLLFYLIGLFFFCL